MSPMYQFNCNLKYPIIMKRFNFERIIAGGFTLEPVMPKMTDLPLVINASDFFV